MVPVGGVRLDRVSWVWVVISTRYHIVGLVAGRMSTYVIPIQQLCVCAASLTARGESSNFPNFHSFASAATRRRMPC